LSGTYPSELMHRFVMDAPCGVEVDHRDGDGLNNTRANLRLCTHAEDCRNQGKTRGKSRFKGVYWHRRGRKWCVFVGKGNYIGLFKTEIEAALAYDAEARLRFGPFAALNFPVGGERGARRLS
jgi:hypothetical protein